MNEPNELDSLLAELSEELEKYLNDDDANKKLEFLPGELTETEERNPQLEENNANTSRVYYSNENAATNSRGNAPSTLNIAVSQADSNVDPNNEEPRNNIEQHRFVSDKVNSPLLINMERKSFQCDQGGKPFSRDIHEVRHSPILSGKKPFTCEICKKLFNHKCSLVNHIRTHTGEKPFSCKICLKVFSRKNNLKVHMRTHTGEKPFKCNFCEKEFTRKQTLKEHAVVHTGEKPFKCNDCEKIFIRKRELTSHAVVHTGEKPFKCELCDSSYAHSSSLRYHQRTHKAQ